MWTPLNHISDVGIYISEDRGDFCPLMNCLQLVTKAPDPFLLRPLIN